MQDTFSAIFACFGTEVADTVRVIKTTSQQGESAIKSLPGTLWINRGRWSWKVKLPGEEKRKTIALRKPGQREALSAGKDRSLAESVAWRIWEQASQIKSSQDGATLDNVAGAFGQWASTYYRRADGTPTREADNCEIALRALRSPYGHKPIDDICYHDILAARESLVEAGLQRTTVNQRVSVWKRFFAWALENRYCTAQTKAEVWAITSLKRNRTPAPEGQPVMPVSHLNVKRTLAYLPPIVQAMVCVQELCGARPGEICSMTPGEIQQRRDVWIYRPRIHKTDHKGQVRVIVLGPRAVAALRPYMDGAPDRPVFSPQVSMTERRRGGGTNPERLGEVYVTASYCGAIRYAIRAARKDGLEVSDWSPNQLRHSCGTRVRRKFGSDAARAVLGHATGAPRITDRYTKLAIEQEVIKTAYKAMIKIG